MKYMVMECHPGYAVVLDEAGRFVKVANMHYEVGQSVSDDDVMELCLPPAPVKKVKNKWRYTAAIMAACLVLVATNMLRLGQTAYASVYMSINPEVRIDVNRKDVAVGLEGINADGKALVEGYRYKNKDLDLVVDELVDRAIEMNFLYEGGTVTLELDTQDNEWIVSHGEHLAAHLQGHLADELDVRVRVKDRHAIDYNDWDDLDDTWNDIDDDDDIDDVDNVGDIDDIDDDRYDHDVDDGDEVDDDGFDDDHDDDFDDDGNDDHDDDVDDDWDDIGDDDNDDEPDDDDSEPNFD